MDTSPQNEIETANQNQSANENQSEPDHLFLDEAAQTERIKRNLPLASRTKVLLSTSLLHFSQLGFEMSSG